MILCPHCRDACAGKCSRSLKLSRRWFIFGSAAALAAKAVGGWPFRAMPVKQRLLIGGSIAFEQEQLLKRLGFVRYRPSPGWHGLEIERVVFEELAELSLLPEPQGLEIELLKRSVRIA